MVYEDKKVSEMTAAEKHSCILDAERSFYAFDNFGRGAATLLEQHMELRGLMNDEKLQAAVKRLHEIEDQVHTLYDKYNAKVCQELSIAHRAHRQQEEGLAGIHTAELRQLYDNNADPAAHRHSIIALSKTQAKEMADLSKRQADEVAAIHRKNAKKLNQKQGILFSLFMSQIHQIYK